MRFYFFSAVCALALIALWTTPNDFRAWGTIAIVVIWSLLFLWGIFDLKLQWFVPVVKDPKNILLTFDDGPVETTAEILDVLSAEGVSAVFFVVGQRVEAHPDLARRILDEGHAIGNHSYHHNVRATFYTRRKYLRELEACNLAVRQAVGKAPVLVRPPFGVSNPGIAGAIKRHGMLCLHWTVRSLDTVRKRAVVLAQLLGKAKAGSIILLHDHGSLGAEGVRELIHGLRQKGMEFTNAKEFEQDLTR